MSCLQDIFTVFQVYNSRFLSGGISLISNYSFHFQPGLTATLNLHHVIFFLLCRSLSVYLSWFLFMCTCVTVSVCVPHVCGCPRRLEEGIGFPGAGVIGECMLLNVGECWNLNFDLHDGVATLFGSEPNI